MKNFKLYALSALAIALAVALFVWPSKPEEKLPVTAVPPPGAKCTNELDEQNYRYLNNKIIALNKQLNTLREAVPAGGTQQTAELYAQLERLSHDNSMLRASNEEAAQKLAHTEQLVNSAAKQNYEEAIAKLGDELAFYKSDNDSLKISLNEKESVIKNLNSLLSTMSNQKQMDEYEHDNQLRQLKKELENERLKASAATKNNADLAQEKSLLKERVSSLSKLEVLNQKLSNELSQQNLQIVELNKELKMAQKSADDARAAMQNNTSTLALENKNLKVKIDEANAQLLKMASVNEELIAQKSAKEQLQKQLDSVVASAQAAKIDYEKRQEASLQELSKLSEQSQAAQKKLSAELAKQSNELSAARQKLSAANSEISELKTANIELNDKLKTTAAKLAQADKTATDAGAKSEQQGALLRDYKEQIALLKKDKIALTSQINALNKEFLSYKNSDFDRSSKDHAQLKDKLIKLSLSYDEMQAKNLALKEELANSQLDARRAAEQINELKSKLAATKNIAANAGASAVRIAELEAANDKLLRDLEQATSKQLGRFSQQNSELAEAKRQLEQAQKRLADASAKSSFASVKEVARISCDDIKVGAAALSEACKLKMSEFLAKFDASYFFEITPIINNGGFRSLARLSASQMEPAEAARLTRLANYGLAKDRIVAAKDFIAAQISGALVGVAAASIESADKKGFLLKIYK